jgi:uncharacterized protein (TIGR02118 family)
MQHDLAGLAAIESSLGAICGPFSQSRTDFAPGRSKFRNAIPVRHARARRRACVVLVGNVLVVGVDRGFAFGPLGGVVRLALWKPPGAWSSLILGAKRIPMPKLIVLYPPPADVIAFERRYQTEHAPMVFKEIPGLKKFFAARVLGTPAGAAPYQRVAELYFDTLESLQAAMASPGGQATVADAIEISTGGPPVVLIAEDDKPA